MGIVRGRLISGVGLMREVSCWYHSGMSVALEFDCIYELNELSAGRLDDLRDLRFSKLLHDF